MRSGEQWTGDTAFEQALNRNAAAKLMFMAMSDREREELRRKADGIHSRQEMDAFVDAVTGGQIGHAPYQL